MVENDLDDRQLTEETFKQEWPGAAVEFIYGADLPGWLQHKSKKPDATDGTPPSLILLTMNANPNGAMNMIPQIRSKEGYGEIPVIVLSETTSPEEIRAAYSAGASSFIKKPSGYEDTLFKIRSFINYWIRTVELPV